MNQNNHYQQIARLLFIVIFNKVLSLVPGEIPYVFAFYTNFNHLLIMIYFIWAIQEGLFRQQNSKYIQSYAVFLIYSSAIVALGFWFAYLINPGMVISKKVHIPFFCLAFLHGGNLIVLLLDVIYFLNLQNLNESDNLEAFFPLACYTGLLIVNYSQYEKFPYPFMRHLRLPINLGIVLLLNIIMSVPYIILKKKLVIKLKKE
ncbi:hypothetical protein pb186bvf_017909 [Paramecium bursaria]